MAKTSNEPLKPNPYLTYRDPETGVWKVIPANANVDSSETKDHPPSKTTKLS